MKRLLLLCSLLFVGCSSGNHEKPYFPNREAADEACFNDLKNHLLNEVKKTSDYRNRDNWSHIKTEKEQYAVLDFGCKPTFKKGSTTGVLVPTYFYLNGGYEEGTVQRRIVYELKPKEAKSNKWSFKYSYPLGKSIDFESKVRTSPKDPFYMPFSSLYQDTLSQGIAIGAVMRTCKSLFDNKNITLLEAEREINQSRDFLRRVNKSKENLLSSEGAENSITLLEKRWKQCKEEES